MTRGRPSLAGVRVLDFSTLLPGPLATLILVEAGAEVVKVERPPRGDDLRHYPPRFGDAGAGFALLNRGKRSVALDLKKDGDVAQVRELAIHADVLVEQFRPGVMERLGLGFEELKADNPRLVFCSITGYGQDGPMAAEAGHDLNYLAQTGLLSLAADGQGRPVLPPGLIADIGGGALPAVIDILMALRVAEQTGEGCRLDVSMSDNLFAWTWWAFGLIGTGGAGPRPSGELLTGGSPRYQVYRTSDGRFVAAAPLEQKFWNAFCELVGLNGPLRDDGADPEATRAEVARLIAARPAEEWRAQFAGQDVCCNVVASLEEALDSPHFKTRGLFNSVVESGFSQMPALPTPLAPELRTNGQRPVSPALGEADAAEIMESWRKTGRRSMAET
jgi:crotonobetainyl-CoA:carnitine CoA-transferase CaiB-like acyl-CoA transferase